MNKVILIGRLGKDPEVRYLSDGTPCTNFSLATSEKWKDKNTGEKCESTEWHNIVAWRRLGEVCGQYLTKGSQICVEGKLQTRSWDKGDGTKGYKTEIVMNNMEMLGGGQRQNNNQEYGAAPQGTVPQQQQSPHQRPMPNGGYQNQAHGGGMNYPNDDDPPF